MARAVPNIEHVFVLMLENRSFDHMLGFSGLSGIGSLTGFSNSFGGASFPAAPPAPNRMMVDPGHEFTDVLEQLCGARVRYPRGGPYPRINNSGFVSNFANRYTPSPGDVMRCVPPSQLPVLTALAAEFALCDAWFSSMPGPTWPNRMFALAASSAGLDHSPAFRFAWWRTFSGLRFPNGTIFDRVSRWRIYSGNVLSTFALALKGIHVRQVRRYNDFDGDLQDTKRPFDAQFTWIEPNYGHVASDFTNGTSQHPLDGVAGGEQLIKETYESIRNSPVWEKSLLIIVWDEHGGFYDNVAPPAAVPPGGMMGQFGPLNKNFFRFDRYGPRVPAVVVSPLIGSQVDHRIFDHASIPATVERLFNLRPLTNRDAAANDVLPLASRETARDAPELPAARRDDDESILDALDVELPAATRSQEPVGARGDSLPGFLFLATRAHLQMSAVTEYPNIFLRRNRVVTRGDARDYLEEVRRIIARSRAVPALL